MLSHRKSHQNFAFITLQMLNHSRCRSCFTSD